MEGRHRQPAVRTDQQPVEPGPHPWGLVGWERGGHRCGHGAVGHRVRWGRVPSDPLVVLWALRDETVARQGPEWWSARARLAASVDQGPDGPAAVRRGGRP